MFRPPLYVSFTNNEVQKQQKEEDDAKWRYLLLFVSDTGEEKHEIKETLTS